MSVHTQHRNTGMRSFEICAVPNLIEGIWRDEVYKKQADGSEVLVSKTARKHNRITEPFTVLVAALLGNDPSLSGGVMYHAIGEGDITWDTSGIPTPSQFDTTLYNELNRKEPDGISYIKWGEGAAVGGSSTTIEDPYRVDGGVLKGRFEPDNFFEGMEITIIQGTNLGEVRTVVGYEQATGIITVDSPYPADIDATSIYDFSPIVTTERTNIIEIRTTWDYGLPTAPYNFKYIREQGLFGGVADESSGSGYMIDRVTHDRIWKDPTIRLVRFLDLCFRV